MTKTKKAKRPLKYSEQEVSTEEELYQNPDDEWNKAKREQEKFP